MRKYCLALFLLFFASFLFAAGDLKHPVLNLSLNFDPTVYMGFTDYKVSSVVHPDKTYADGEELNFIYNRGISAYEITKLYYFVQVFVPDRIQFTISPTCLRDESDTSADYSCIDWSTDATPTGTWDGKNYVTTDASTTDLPYISASSSTEWVSTGWVSGYNQTVEKNIGYTFQEKEGSNIPRYYSGQLLIRVPRENINNTATTYRATISIEAKTIS